MEHGYRLHFRCMYHSHLAPPSAHAAFITSGSCCGCEPESCTSWRRFRVHILAARGGGRLGWVAAGGLRVFAVISTWPLGDATIKTHLQCSVLFFYEMCSDSYRASYAVLHTESPAYRTGAAIEIHPHTHTHRKRHAHIKQRWLPLPRFR